MVNVSSQKKVPLSASWPPFIQVARPLHWIKNLAIFAALIFTGNLFNQPLFIITVWAFLTFNFATSAGYIFNDIFDVQRDRLHPVKKFRPIASGQLALSSAWLEALFLALLSIYLALQLSLFFLSLILAYLCLQVAYSLFLKNVPVLDILVIATGFILRIYSGAFIINAHLSVWFLLCVVSVALFLASGKRRAELVAAETPAKTRKSLTFYSRPLLNSYVTMFGNAAWMSWALFTFFESPKASLPVWLFLAEISKTTTVNKLLMLTIPVSIFGIMRYQNLIFEDRSEAPEKLFLTDVSLVSSIVLWVVMVIWILYSGVSITPV